jgi:molybdopterin molybdotransferase
MDTAGASLSELIPVGKAQELILGQVVPLPAETVSLADAYGRTIAVDLSSDIDVSPFDNSAMDGFAFRAADVENASADNESRLEIVAHIAAGDWYDQEVQPGQCVRIMTGAAMPDGADSGEPEKHKNACDVDGDGNAVVLASKNPNGNVDEDGGNEISGEADALLYGIVDSV